jgi:hypothetical protein
MGMGLLIVSLFLPSSLGIRHDKREKSKDGERRTWLIMSPDEEFVHLLQSK